MGKVLVQLKLTNSFELEMKQRKLLKGQPRRVKAEALVDTGATRLYLQAGSRIAGACSSFPAFHILRA
jgi:hypothetical protein